MDILFLVLTLGCLGFLARIILDYTREAPTWSAKIIQAEKEREQYESQVGELAKAKENSAEQAKVMDEEIKVMEQMRDEIKAQIEENKKEMARKGRIIMHRKGADSSADTG